MRLIVTGGAGFIGSHVVELLCNNNHTVTVIDDLRFGYERFVDKRAKLLKVPLEEVHTIEKEFEGVFVVIHLAASSIIKSSYQEPIKYFENNVMNGMKLLEVMKKKGVKKIIYSSTSSVYGQPKKIPIKEDDPTIPLNAYAASKLTFEQILIAYYHSYGIHSVTFRYFNVYGPRDEQKPRTRAIPMWIEAILDNKPVPWYWQGRQIRDYIYIKDAVQVYLDVLSLRGIHCFNIGSGRAVQMKDILNTLQKIAGKKLELIDMGERKGDPIKSYADITKIEKTAGWLPKTSLEEGLKMTYAYYEQARKTTT